MTTRVVSVGSKNDENNNKKLKIGKENWDRIKGKETNVMGIQECTTVEKGNHIDCMIRINKI